MELLKPTNDYVFKKIFGKSGNEDILTDLLQAILGIKLKQVKVETDVTLERSIEDSKLGILDIKATLENNTLVDLEMQILNNHNIIERSLFYLAGMYHESLNKGQDYKQSYKAIVIFIMDFDYFSEGPFHEIAHMKRDYENIILTDKFEIHLIQLPKFKKKCRKISGVIEEWLTFINFKMMEDGKMPDFKNKMVKKAVKELEYLSGDKAERRLAELRDKAIRDENDGRKYEREQGIKEGIEQGKRQGIEQGRIEGIEKGKIEGIEQGIEQEKIEIAKNMLAKKIDIELIIELTGLNREEIEKLI